MFRRLIFESSAAWFTIAAFVTAFSIYALFAWRALRMKRSQVRYFEYLPFETETPPAELEGPPPCGPVLDENRDGVGRHGGRPSRNQS
jgi:hypothetical protein